MEISPVVAQNHCYSLLCYLSNRILSRVKSLYNVFAYVSLNITTVWIAWLTQYFIVSFSIWSHLPLENVHSILVQAFISTFTILRLQKQRRKKPMYGTGALGHWRKHSIKNEHIKRGVLKIIWSRGGKPVGQKPSLGGSASSPGDAVHQWD